MIYPQETGTQFGFTISARNDGAFKSWVFLSGMSLEAGKFRVILPLRPGDFVPVWGTEGEAAAVVAQLRKGPLEAWEFQVLDAGFSYCAGGVGSRNRLMRGVGGFVLPEKPGYVFASELKHLNGV
jgi:hypothetical protein